MIYATFRTTAVFDMNMKIIDIVSHDKWLKFENKEELTTFCDALIKEMEEKHKCKVTLEIGYLAPMSLMRR